MAEPFTLIAASLGVNALGAVSKWFGADTQARRMREQTAEQVRRQRAEQAQRMGQAEVAAGASGVEFGSTSLQQHLASMRGEFQRQLEWTQRAGNRAANDVSAAGTIGALTDLGGSLFSFGAANNWWREVQKPASTYTGPMSPGWGGR